MIDSEQFINLCENTLEGFRYAILVRMLIFLKRKHKYAGHFTVIDEISALEDIYNNYEELFVDYELTLIPKTSLGIILHTLEAVNLEYISLGEVEKILVLNQNILKGNVDDKVEIDTGSDNIREPIRNDYLTNYESLSYVKDKTQADIDFSKIVIVSNEYEKGFQELKDRNFRSLRDEELPKEVLKLKNMIEELHEFVETCVTNQTDNQEIYIRDVLFAAGLYDILNNHTNNKFKLCDASNDDFWVYLSFNVLAEIVLRRKGNDNENSKLEDYYYKKRIYFKFMWWFIHTSFNYSFEVTVSMLMKPCFTTDTILQTMDRVGAFGYDVEVYRLIIKKISILHDKNNELKFNPLLRTVLKLHVAKLPYVEPKFYSNGKIGYVDSLFEDAGV